jgi:hypothetical protein
MSIFKQTLSKTIQDQLAARTTVVNGRNDNRSQLLPWYLSKNSWTRMTSMVNYTSGDVKFNGNGLVEIDPKDGYSDTQLARKNILEGGQLYLKSNNQDLASLRKNIASVDGAYGGNFDARGDLRTADPIYTRQFGIRPMPGITSVRLNTVSAYGSLFETNVSFYAWDNHQLNELEILFMRPGYSVLLEWGWSQYISNNNVPTVFNGLTVPAFKNLTQQDIYDQIEGLRIKHDHNYDGMLGYVKNFSWKMLKNGGYECSTTLISMGEAINSLKISTNNIKINEKPSFDTTSKDNYVYDDFENIFISLKVDGEIKSYLTKDVNKKPFLNEEEYKGNWSYDKNYISRSKIANKLKPKYPELAEKILEQPYVKAIKSGDEKILPADGKTYEYISLDIFMAIVDVYFNLQVTSKKSPSSENTKDNIVKIIPPGIDDYCLASRDSISVDPSVCLVSNPLAFQNEFIEGINPVFEKNKGVITPVYATFARVNKEGYRSGFVTLPPFYDENLKVGLIGEIYVNISLLLNEYKNIKNASNDEGVNLTVYFKNVLNKISNALGGLNNFSLSTAGRDQNTLRIIDLYYLEQDSSNKKYEFDLMGLNTIVRDANVESQIFENQSTIVAIAAQSRANLGDVYNSTQVYLNAGIEDRVALSKFQPEELNSVINKGNKDNTFYAKLFNFLLYVRDNVVGASADDKFAISTSNSGTVPYSFLKQFMLKYNGELNFKALLPFKLNIKLDGIGGIVVGEIFKVKKDILPRNYADKNLGFIITKISHDLTNNDWETTLETQICLLDNISLGKEFITTSRQGFGEYVALGVKDALIIPALVNFMEYLALKSFISSVLTLENDNQPIQGTANVFRTNKYAGNDDLFKTIQNNIKEDLSADILFSPDRRRVNVYNAKSFREYFIDWKTSAQTLSPINDIAVDNINNIKITDTLTYSQALDELANSQLVQDISNNISNNLDLFYSFDENGIWTGVFDNNFVKDLGYKTLKTNIQNKLQSRNIISEDLILTYSNLYTDGNLISAFNPINNPSSLKLAEPFILKRKAQGLYTFQNQTEYNNGNINGTDEDLLAQWFFTITRSRNVLETASKIIFKEN